MHIGLSGYFVVEKRSEGGILLDRWEFENTILNQGLDLFAAAATVTGFVRLSTSTTPPAVTDTAMGGTSLSSNQGSPIFVDSDTNQGAATYHTVCLRGKRFAAGAATGTWSMIGMGTSGLDAGLFCKTLIKDAGGTPTSITVLAAEILDVRYELRMYPPLADQAGSIVVNGTTYNYTARPFNVTEALKVSALQGVLYTVSAYHNPGSLALAAITAVSPFTGSSGNVLFGSGSPASYVNGNYYVQYTVTAATTDVPTGSAFRGLSIAKNPSGAGGATNWHILFDANIAKSNLDTFTVVFRESWARQP